MPQTAWSMPQVLHSSRTAIHLKESLASSWSTRCQTYALHSSKRLGGASPRQLRRIQGPSLGQKSRQSRAQAAEGESQPGKDPREKAASAEQAFHSPPQGYTPFEYITFGENQLTHELSIEVDSPVAVTYAAWRAQRNYGEWLDIIGHTILHRGDEKAASFFIYYQWGHLPPLELYVTLATAVESVNEELYLEAVDGFPLAVCILFEIVAANRSRVSLRVAYQMPANLDLYVGPAGVWGDVNDILQSSLYVMKEQVEAGTAVMSFS